MAVSELPQEGVVGGGREGRDLHVASLNLSSVLTNKRRCEIYPSFLRLRPDLATRRLVWPDVYSRNCLFRFLQSRRCVWGPESPTWGGCVATQLHNCSPYLVWTVAQSKTQLVCVNVRRRVGTNRICMVVTPAVRTSRSHSFSGQAQVLCAQRTCTVWHWVGKLFDWWGNNGSSNLTEEDRTGADGWSVLEKKNTEWIMSKIFAFMSI